MILPTAPNPGRMELFGQDSRLFIGMLVSAPHAETFRLWQLLRAWSSQEVDRSPAAATVNFRAEVQQVGCPAERPIGLARLLAPPVQGHDTDAKRARNFALQFPLRRQIICLR